MDSHGKHVPRSLELRRAKFCLCHGHQQAHSEHCNRSSQHSTAFLIKDVLARNITRPKNAQVID